MTKAQEEACLSLLQGCGCLAYGCEIFPHPRLKQTAALVTHLLTASVSLPPFTDTPPLSLLVTGDSRHT